MKKILILIYLSISFDAFSDFIHPMDFDSSEAQKNRVIQIIKSRVKKDYCDGGLDMCQATTLRMMEQENLKAFKSASQAKDRKIMDSVIKSYCNSGVDMCTYTTILMMYKQDLKASEDSLSW